MVWPLLTSLASSQNYVLSSFLSSQKATSLSFLKWPSSLASKPLYMLFLLLEHFSSSSSFSLSISTLMPPTPGSPPWLPRLDQVLFSELPQPSPACSESSRSMHGSVSPTELLSPRRADLRMSQSHLCPQHSGTVAWGIAVEEIIIQSQGCMGSRNSLEFLYSGHNLEKLPNLLESLVYKMVKQFLLNPVGNCIRN